MKNQIDIYSLRDIGFVYNSHRRPFRAELEQLYIFPRQLVGAVKDREYKRRALELFSQSLCRCADGVICFVKPHVSESLAQRCPRAPFLNDIARCAGVRRNIAPDPKKIHARSGHRCPRRRLARPLLPPARNQSAKGAEPLQTPVKLLLAVRRLSPYIIVGIIHPCRDIRRRLLYPRCGLYLAA